MENTPDPASMLPQAERTASPNTFTQRRAMLAGLGGLAAGAFMARSAQAGPLNPPPGPIASTPGPEPRIPVNQENTPGNSANTFVISQPGSYYLTGNVLGEAGKNGIRITSSNVTLDLMGFECRGVPDSLDGINLTGFLPGITIRNGTVSGWGQNGLFVRIDSGLIDGVHVHSNGGSGMRSIGRQVLIRACSAFSNGLDGIDVGGWSRIESCLALENGSAGVKSGGNGIIEGCNARNNGGFGIDTQAASVVTGCSASGNSGGIRVAGRSLVLDNTLDSNLSEAGILTPGQDNRIEGNNCTQNQVGIRCPQPGNFLARNTCSSNGTNWDIASGNICLVILAAAGGAISGNSGGVSPGSTNPNANYTY